MSGCSCGSLGDSLRHRWEEGKGEQGVQGAERRKGTGSKRERVEKREADYSHENGSEYSHKRQAS